MLAFDGCDVYVEEEGQSEVQVSVAEEDTELVRFSEISPSTAPDIEEEMRFQWKCDGIIAMDGIIKKCKKCTVGIPESGH